MSTSREAIPSGQQIELRRGDQRAAVVELGGSLRSYSFGEREVLDGHRRRPRAHCADHRHADARGLTVQTTATNIGAAECPYGASAPLSHRRHAAHRRPHPEIAGSWLDANRRPSDPHRPRAGPCNPNAIFQSPKRIGTTELDTGCSELQRDPDGRARVTLRAPNGEAGVTLWMDEQYPYLMLFTGDSLTAQARRRRGLGVEPMTCAPNAYQTGEGLLRPHPGDSVTSAWGIEPA